MTDERSETVSSIIPQGWDDRPYDLVRELKRLLRPLVDDGSPMDSGTTDKVADLTVYIDGVAYLITVMVREREGRH